jgi:hypothetical protein
VVVKKAASRRQIRNAGKSFRVILAPFTLIYGWQRFLFKCGKYVYQTLTNGGEFQAS